MKVELVTQGDLENLKESLLEEIKKLLKPEKLVHKKWLRSAEVRKILMLSPGSLQNLRIKGKLHPRKIGGLYYYSSDEIEKLFKE